MLAGVMKECQSVAPTSRMRARGLQPTETSRAESVTGSPMSFEGATTISRVAGQQRDIVWPECASLDGLHTRSQSPLRLGPFSRHRQDEI